MTEIKTYDDALNFIHGRFKAREIPTLARMRKLLKRLGNPQNGQSYIHVTGTNGKGSTVTMIRAMLMASGYQVGTFTSPFITRFNERIALNGQPISDRDLVTYTRQVATVVDQMDAEGQTPTEFEINTAIMFLYFADRKPDVVILEVGIGGLFDSTNVIEKPDVAVIVTVGYDHMQFLGDSLTEIATIKAGIIKKHSPVVVGQLPEEAKQVIVSTAKKKQSPLFQLGQEFHAQAKNSHQLAQNIEYQGLSLAKTVFQLGLAGDYQVQNAGVAITTVQLWLQKHQGYLDPSNIAEGLLNAHWPGRMEIVNREPLMILDGAHNLPGVQALVQTIEHELADREVYLLVAILADKQYELMLGELASLRNVHLVLTQFSPPGPKRPTADLAGLKDLIRTRYPMQVFPEWQLGLAAISQQVSAEDVILITGSLYFISEVRNFLLAD
ncbi:bifunctional folylpolyglutamate synthase/dihydrofolate synthase [Limosilactobacillus gastricus]|uniref:tetrahydrofolate synthase n=1 Tax=Limosilactobacillus gastricus DSM 16045 TaxID=1423749 RepID=A0A0R1VKS6_9LACO|nr:folylpolyglutamate synthase/dihydrofolate synthase family protein [Limosilactobacillus gastricus]KRM03462.1 Folylpolyglutamate synthase [Limosilactobacillus gastricus DSM 16045]QGF40830.1 bifunctional folylpolyglutamate synthase/dihydrofolate synthase [Limosilactobacillus gastricus]